MLRWIIDHWELLVPLLAAVAVLGFDLFQQLRKKETASVRAYLTVILLFLTIIVITMIHEDKPEIDHIAGHLKTDYAIGNPYVEDFIQDDLTDLKNALTTKQFETKSLTSTVEELLRALKYMQKGDRINAIDYGIPWGSTFMDYQQANIRAAANGVIITRIFIIPDLIVKNEGKAAPLLESMQEQSRNGIKVEWVKESEISKHINYQNAMGMVEFKFGSRGSVLMVEAIPYWQAVDRNEPPRLLVYWGNAPLIQNEERNFDWLISGLPPGTVRTVDAKNQGGSPRPF